ncbi:type II secretion system protein GspL [Shewanella frigidimarina]|uniref:Type II secretion system protein L n=1 Tax=Shewanella frigidimarina (strain NCIMB 400) TaxID=318167 RepID=Q089T9_SHEFN|nr:type II secretion system protein GspL [Shewanella frigidimarina]ABI69976.1 general secretion pathway protein L [Shewanella frigidimarina NCIMB 400]
MSERLFIRLGKSSEHPCSWLVWSEQEQEIIASGELSDAASLSTLAERAGNRPVDVLVPAANMTLTQIMLPEKGQRQALKALPYMLEESLATNVDNMHFVVGPREGEQLNVAAVAHEQMQIWLEWLHHAGLKVKRIVPDCLALPLEQCRWAAMSVGSEYLIRTSEGSGVSMPKAWSAFALPKLLIAAKPNDNESISVASYSDDIVFEGVDINNKPLDLPMMVLAKGILNAPINLLSGIYKPKHEYSKQLLTWKNAAIVVMIAIVLALANKGIAIHQLNNQTTELQAQSEMIFKQAVPGVNRIVNMRSQMGSELRSMQGQGGGAVFFEMLDGLKPAFSKVPELKPNTLRYEANRNELRMQVTAKTYGQIDTFKELVSKDYLLEGGAMNSSEESVTSTLTLRNK